MTAGTLTGRERLGSPAAGMGTISVEVRLKPVALFGLSRKLIWDGTKRQNPHRYLQLKPKNPRPKHKAHEECSMKKGQDTRGYERYMALDIHREYILVGAWNEEKDWVLTPRRVSTEKFPEWAKKNIRTGDIMVLETTTNVWTTYDIVVPLAGRVLVANAAEVGEIANARVKTDKEDVKRLLKLLIGGIVPEVWVPPIEVRELRAFVS